MFKHYFEQIHNVEVWPIISLSIFVTFFIGLTIYVIKINKDHIRHMEDLPLRDEGENVQQFNDHLKNL